METKLLFAFALLAGCLFNYETTRAQPLSAYRVVNRIISPGKEQGSIHLSEANNDGIAWLKGKTFTNGTIELDIKGRDILQRSFVGIAFHGLNDATFEAIYFRPFNFRNTDPVRRAHAVQWVGLPKYDWELLRNTYPGKYEKPINPAPEAVQWFHAKVVVKGKHISVFVNGQKQPSLTVESLVNYNGKQIGFWVGNGSDGDFRALKISTN